MSDTPPRLSVSALTGVPEVAAGDDLAAIVLAALAASGERLAEGDVLVLAQKIVSKAEGRIVDLAAVAPSAPATALAAETGKDARLVELILGESERVLRTRPGLIIVVHKRGWVLANAGIDASNVPSAEGAERVLLLPEDPDASAAALREALRARCGIAPGVIVSDSLGRAWRLGTIGTALGAAGIEALCDLRGTRDRSGRILRVTEVGLADAIAAAAAIVMGEADEGRPIALVRGLGPSRHDGRGRDLLRPVELDLFR